MAKLSDFLPRKKTCSNCGNYMCIDLRIHRERYVERCTYNGRQYWIPKEDGATDTDVARKTEEET